jgi:transcriptional regulator with XRE-family HTH domain
VNPRTPQNPKDQIALGGAIRELRNKKGATQEDLAKGAGISRNMLSQIERGAGNPSWVTLRRVAAALGVSVSMLAKAAETREGS